MFCPPFIPLLITFHDSDEMITGSSVAPTDRRRSTSIYRDDDAVVSTVRRCVLQYTSNFVNFYNAAIVKFCFHSVTMLYGFLQVL